MAREAGVCNECYKNCLLLHRGKQDRPQKVATFFKVMFGKRFSELLFVPPKQSQMLTSLVGKPCYLEDSTGHEWKVVLSYVEGCLAFKEGWHKFSRDHDIEQGDFLVFHFNMESTFVVTVYGRSGWEKTFSGEQNHQNKRAKTATNLTTKKVPSEGLELQQNYGYLDAYVVPPPDNNSICSHGVVNNVDKSLRMARNVPKADIPSQGVANNVDKPLPAPRNVPKAELILEPSFLTEKETTFAREDDREHLLDLSAFELPDMMTEMTTDTREYHTEHPSYLPSFEYPDLISSVAREEDEGYLCDLSTSEKIDNIVDANHIGELQGSKCSQSSGLHGVQAGEKIDNIVDANHIGELQGSKCSQNSGLRGVQTGDASTQPGQGSTAQPSKNEAIKSTFECSPTANVSPSLDMPLDSPKPLKTIMKNEKFEPSAAESGGTSVGQGIALPPSNEKEAILSTYESSPTAGVSPALDMPLDSPKPLKTIINDKFGPSAAEPGYIHSPEEHEAILSTSECSPIRSISPDLQMPLNSRIHLKDAGKSDILERLTTPGCIQPPGETVRIIKQRPREFEQDHFRNLDFSCNKKPKVIHGDLDVNLKILEDDGGNCEDLGVNLKPMKDNVCNRKDHGVNFQPREDYFCNLEDLGANLRPTEDDVPVMQPVKSEPVDSEDVLTSATANRITCSIPPDNESFLELPEPLPVVKLRQGKKLKQKLILLRDPDGDDWPVVYHEKYGVKVLASGWNAFRKANNVNPGDECAFMLNDSDKGLFRVHILKT